MTPLERAIAAGDLPRAQAIVATKSRAKSSARTRRKEREPRAKGASREQRRDERRKRMADVREAVLIRADGKCEVCGRTGFVLEAHHLLSGPLRRLEESPETVLAICMDCHRGLHRNDPATLRRMWEVCGRLGMAKARAAVGRRIAKVLEAIEARHG